MTNKPKQIDIELHVNLARANGEDYEYVTFRWQADHTESVDQVGDLYTALKTQTEEWRELLGPPPNPLPNTNTAAIRDAQAIAPPGAVASVSQTPALDAASGITDLGRMNRRPGSAFQAHKFSVVVNSYLNKTTQGGKLMTHFFYNDANGSSEKPLATVFNPSFDMKPFEDVISWPAEVDGYEHPLNATLEIFCRTKAKSPPAEWPYVNVWKVEELPTPEQVSAEEEIPF